MVLVLFSLLMQFARAVFTEGAPDDVNMLARLAWEILGAAAVGSLIGAVFALYLRYIGKEVTLALLLVALILSQVGATQRVEPLLAAMAAGIVIANLAVPQGEMLKAAIQTRRAAAARRIFRGGGRIASAGYTRHRGSDRNRSCRNAHRAHLDRRARRTACRASVDPSGEYIWTGLISQAGITLGLSSTLAAEFPTWGTQVQMLLVALIAIDELIGPALFRTGLARSGEIDATAPRPLLVVSNREPYVHSFDARGQIVCSAATGGVAVALDALMRERGGTWIAHGGGTADPSDAPTSSDKIAVPPGVPAYGCAASGFPRTISQRITADSRTRACGRCVISWTCARSFEPTIGRRTRR